MSVKVGKLGTIRLKGADLERVRRACFIRDGWRCQDCLRVIGWASGHMAHIKSRGAGGSDVMDNVRTLCLECHSKEHNCGGKPLPRKPVV
jgi:5-methylcytosine-specific restriction endonuclease McrA